MGYTHYWNKKATHPSDKENFKLVLADAKKLFKHLPKFTDSAGGYHDDSPVELFGGLGTGEPEFTEELIRFNGDETKGLDHETFHVGPEFVDFEFCKTARKPYDLMACAVLISMKKHMVGFTYSSDGDKEDWAPAKKFYRNVMKRK